MSAPTVPMDSRVPKPLQVHLNGGALASVRTELEDQRQLLRAVQAGLPVFLKPHCRHCLARNDCLLVYVDAPVWASQMRFQGPDLLAQLERSTGRRFRGLRVRNLMPGHTNSAGLLIPSFAPPASHVGEMLRHSAENSPGEIQSALLRLSHTIERLRKKTALNAVLPPSG